MATYGDFLMAMDNVARRTGLGVAVQGFHRGDLVPDQVVLDMVREAVVAARAAGGGYVLDVFADMEQARALYLIAVELGMTADVALHLEAGDAEVARRPARAGGAGAPLG